MTNQSNMSDKSPTTNNASLSELMHESTCPACGHHVAVTFYRGGSLPLTTQAWPQSAQEAHEMPRHPHEFVRCIDCGHVFNREFRYENVPYQTKPNLMYNRGKTWEAHIERVKQLLLDQLPEVPTVVEIGCGDGTLLCSMAAARPQGRFYGFDPNAQIETGGGLIEARATLFEPSKHIAELKPDLIISRHVLEHLMNPLGFVQQVAFASSWEDAQTKLYIEVPCIDRVFELNRTIDFYYEHRSHFTSNSLTKMLERCSSEVEMIATGYNNEVVMGLASFGKETESIEVAQEAIQFSHGAMEAKNRVRTQLKNLQAAGKRIAIWGGTGKAASFINQFDLDEKSFPLIVDSDAAKVGTHVPGMGQKILYRDLLVRQPADVILIATQWRARDIAMEIESAGIQADSLLVEWRGELIDYHLNADLFDTNRGETLASKSNKDHRPPERAPHLFQPFPETVQQIEDIT
ncbi:tRNA (guanine-N(7)-)-methyltransferase [Polystyrenella longa]|uniref:tRNA (Guanine-N(7)-)-methyltransferase n=1 Tax=Polystyrenella longa TaxID=2528007 RepID=A0A518CP96_9PLAN|nr:class I SAM-dependent methyltransferase [Polystyrenella longa]QDU81045.1 tRNA (guanine-N(7)-)-methyltransferase [Polystyrenella longa]